MFQPTIFVGFIMFNPMNIPFKHHEYSFISQYLHGISQHFQAFSHGNPPHFPPRQPGLPRVSPPACSSGTAARPGQGRRRPRPGPRQPGRPGFYDHPIPSMSNIYGESPFMDFTNVNYSG